MPRALSITHGHLHNLNFSSVDSRDAARSAYQTAVQDFTLDTVMRPEGLRSNIFFSAVYFIRDASPLSLDTSYEKSRAKVSGKHSSFVIKQTVMLRV